MTPVLTLLFEPPYWKPLASWLGWVGWALFMLASILLIWRSMHMRRQGGLSRWLLVLLFLILSLLANLFFGVRLPSGAALPEPGIPLGPRTPALMFFSALPWMLAGGVWGPLEACLVGLAGGLVRSLWETHNLFTVLEPALLAILFSVSIQQPYRTWFYRLIRQPLVIGPVLVGLYALLFVLGAFFAVNDTLPARLDFA
ncbi:MAG: hypothetical protein NZL98_10730, partial [Anaerolineales bacterium]|nr:hypothetical protein [Anaerolineales bacterium]